MRKILILGLSGSGKNYLSETLFGKDGYYDIDKAGSIQGTKFIIDVGRIPLNYACYCSAGAEDMLSICRRVNPEVIFIVRPDFKLWVKNQLLKRKEFPDAPIHWWRDRSEEHFNREQNKLEDLVLKAAGKSVIVFVSPVVGQHSGHAWHQDKYNR